MSSSSNQATFETSFADDVNGAAFKDLINKTNNNNNSSGNSSSNSSNNDDQKQQQQQPQRTHQHQHQHQHQQQLANIKFPSSNLNLNSNEQQETGNSTTNAAQQDSSAPPEDLNLFINDLLEQMQSKFENMGNTIIGRIDDMGSRIDTLEKSIGDLMDQSGLSEPTYGHGSSGHSNSIMKKNVDKSDDLSSSNSNF